MCFFPSSASYACFAAAALVASVTADPGALDLFPPTVGWFSTTLDHFHYDDNRTFQLKYLVYDQYWTSPSGPILFYLGNEGAIEDFYNNTGAVFEFAPEIGALVVFCEHRYYGASLPFGDASFEKKNFHFLTIEQAMADYAVFLDSFKTNHSCTEDGCNTVVLGGSYGGMLAAWFRVKYPHLTIGALAAGAPVDFYPGQGKQGEFWNATLHTFGTFGVGECDKVLDRAMSLVRQWSSETERVSSIFQTCLPLSSPENIDQLELYLRGAVASLAMLDYPIPTDFVTALPAHPVRTACASAPKAGAAAADEELLSWLNTATNILVNASGTLRCKDIGMELVGHPAGLHALRPSKMLRAWQGSSSMDMQAWNYQACTELILEPLTSDGFGFYPPEEDRLDAVASVCRERFSVEPRPRWLPLSTGGSDFRFASNILFTDGEKDPWRVGAPNGLKFGATVKHILIPGAAHHEDLRFTTPETGAEVAAAKAAELSQVKQWLGLGPINSEGGGSKKAGKTASGPVLSVI